MSVQESPELLSYLSGNDALKLLEVIQSSITCTSEADFSSLFPKIQELFSFDFAGVLLGNLDDIRGLILAHGLNISFPGEWLSAYTANNYFHQDVLTVETFRTCKAKHWTYEIPGVEDLVPKEIISLNMDFRAREAYAHGSPPASPGQNGSMFCFAGPAMNNDMRTTAILEVVVPHLHLVFNNIFSKAQSKTGSPGIVLSSREKEVLHWLKQGKSSWDMSVILSLSERTINYHVYNIMEKLGAINRPQAVSIALHLGLIELG